MRLAVAVVASAAVCHNVAALHEHQQAKVAPGGGVRVRAGCVPPGQCTPPSTAYSLVIPGPQPGQQWNTAGGFCGAFSVQHAALAFGAWISQDLVRKANRDQNIPHCK
jgi:hypothetical protein